MKSRQGYKGYVIEERAHELREGSFSAEYCVKEHDAYGVTERQFYLTDTFRSEESAIAAATQAGRRRIDAGFERTGGGEWVTTGFHSPVPAPQTPVLRARLFFALVSGSLLAGARRVQIATLPCSRFDAVLKHFGAMQTVPECDFALFRSTRTRTR